MTPDRTLTVPADRVEAVARLLRRSIATDVAEIRRLRMLGTVYHDRPTGSHVDPEIEQARRQRDAAEELLAQLAP
jgi:hypothetical protein